ncbi:DNA adenine methylase [Clostridioides difficile]
MKERMIEIEQLRFSQIEKLETNTTKENNSYEVYKFPQTRYQGSKLKILNWIWESVENIDFNTVLDVFGGTGCVSYMFKQKGKKVIYNDLLKFNHVIGKALIENADEKLSDEEIDNILKINIDIEYPTFIQDNFQGIFYLDEENKWLDMIVTNIRHIENEYKQSIAWFALFQACIIKRPYNLFHRKNLNLRTEEVTRSFGNKTTWDTPFEKHFLNFIEEANNAVFSNKVECKSLNYDALKLPIDKYDVDLVYIDSPYISKKGLGTDYIDFYHFLEGMLNYDEWNTMIVNKLKHKPIVGRNSSVWINKKEIYLAFEQLFNKYKKSTIIVSYREDGIPSIDELVSIMKNYKKDVKCVSSKEYKYALSAESSKEVIIIGR